MSFSVLSFGGVHFAWPLPRFIDTTLSFASHDADLTRAPIDLVGTNLAPRPNTQRIPARARARARAAARIPRPRAVGDDDDANNTNGGFGFQFAPQPRPQAQPQPQPQFQFQAQPAVPQEMMGMMGAMMNAMMQMQAQMGMGGQQPRQGGGGAMPFFPVPVPVPVAAPPARAPRAAGGGRRGRRVDPLTGGIRIAPCVTMYPPKR